MPRLQALYDEYGSRGYVPLSINLWENMETVVKYYASQYTYPFFRDPNGGPTWALYRMNGYIPLNYVIDTAGLVVGSMEGFNEYTIRSWVEPYLTGVAEQPKGTVLAFAGATPNPAVGPQTVTFSLPAAGSATLRVYSSSGRTVRTLVSGTLDAGQRTARWDLRDEGGRAVGNGTYFYELTAAGRTVQLRTTVLR